MIVNIGLKKCTFSLLIAMSIASVSVSQSIKRLSKSITGTFIDLNYDDVRNKYMNPPAVDEMSPQFWWTKLKEYSDMGIKYIVIQFVADSAKAYYPSKFMKHAYPKEQESPVESIIKAADEYGMKVFVGSGWTYDYYDNTSKPETRRTMIKIMKEIESLYGGNKSFYGWYIPAEADLSHIISSNNMVKNINELAEAAKRIAPNRKVMISPYGTWNAKINDKRFKTQIKKLKVDIIAYQDEIGCVREPFPIPKMKKRFKKLVQITKNAGIEFWSNIESFTWSKEPNSHYSALIPAPFPRYLSQIVGETLAGAQELISFAIFGIMDDPNSSMPIGQPITSAGYYKDYMDWKEGKGRWPLLAKTFTGNVPNKATGKAIHFYTKPSSKHNKDNLTDNSFGGEDVHDSNWVQFNHGKMIFEVDLDSVTNIHSVALRFLQFKPMSIFLPSMIDYYFSKDGINYWKGGTTIAEQYPQDHLDCWIDLEQLESINESARFVKAVAHGIDDSRILCDEILIQ